MSANQSSWQTTPPAEPGQWEMRSDETGQEPSSVVVFDHGGELWVKDPHVGTNPLEDYHYNLCKISWRKTHRGSTSPAASPKTVAEQALCDLLAMPVPRTERDFRRAVVIAALTGRQIEADFQTQQNQPNQRILTSPEHDKRKPRT